MTIGRLGPSEGARPSLVRAAAGGDAQALRALWHEHRRWVAAVLIAAKPRQADLEDLLQEVALTMVRQIHTVEDEAAFRGWLRQVALNTARAAGRKATRRGALDRAHAHDLACEHHPGDEPESLAEREEARRLMRLAQDLPEAYREPLLLRCVRGMSYRAISGITGLPETTVETRIARGRRMLREIAAQDHTPTAPQAQAATR